MKTWRLTRAVAIRHRFNVRHDPMTVNGVARTSRAPTNYRCTLAAATVAFCMETTGGEDSLWPALTLN